METNLRPAMRCLARRLAPFAAACLLLAGCSPLGKAGRLSVEAPPCPAAWSDLVRERGMALELSVADAEGRRVLAEDLAFGAEVEIPLPEKRSAIFLARPRGGRAELEAAGAIYPLHAADGVLALDFRRGWIACFALCLESLDPEAARAFNYARLEEEAAAKLPDPWLCPPAELAGIAASGDFNLYRIKARERFPLSLSLPARAALPDGPWFPASPFSGPFSESGGFLAADLPEGTAFLYRGRERLCVTVDARGRAGAILMPD